MSDQSAIPYTSEAAALGDAWCFVLTRRRLGSPRDFPGDMAYEFQNLLDMGFSFAELQDEINKRPPARDRSEYMWQFRDRLKLRKFGDPKKPGPPPKPPETRE